MNLKTCYNSGVGKRCWSTSYKTAAAVDMWVSLKDYSLKLFILFAISAIMLMIAKIARIFCNILFQQDVQFRHISSKLLETLT